jgi:hypothetical protein
MKNQYLFGISMTLYLTTTAVFGQASSFPKSMYTETGCSEAYFNKARSLNKILGFSTGALGIAGATVLPGSALLLLGGISAAGETGYTYLEEHEDADKKKMAPRVRYPFARQYYDITNALELNKIIEQNKQDEEISEYIPMYIDSLFISKQAQADYKECKSLGKLSGLSRGEIKEIEDNLMTYLEKYDKIKSQKLLPLDQAKNEMANCLLEINDDGNYPIADRLLIKNELKTAKLLTWRFKSSIRLYKYVRKQVNKAGLDINASKFFEILNNLDRVNSICQIAKKPLNRKKLSAEFIKELKK